MTALAIITRAIKAACELLALALFSAALILWAGIIGG